MLLHLGYGISAPSFPKHYPAILSLCFSVTLWKLTTAMRQPRQVQRSSPTGHADTIIGVISLIRAGHGTTGTTQLKRGVTFKAQTKVFRAIPPRRWWRVKPMFIISLASRSSFRAEVPTTSTKGLGCHHSGQSCELHRRVEKSRNKNSSHDPAATIFRRDKLLGRRKCRTTRVV